MTTPVAEMLRHEYPNAHIAWVVEDKSKDAVIGNPFVDEVIVWKRKTGRKTVVGEFIDLLISLRSLREELKLTHFDVAIDFQGLLRSSLVGLVSGAKYRIGGDDAGEGATFFYNKHGYIEGLMPLECKNYVSMTKLIEVYSKNMHMYFPVTENDRVFAQEFISGVENDKPGYRGFVGMCPATTWAQKHWTEQGWAELADRLLSEYKLIPIFLGSKSDNPLIDRICGLMRYKAASATGRTTLKQAAAIMELCKLVIAVDTGLLHISMALDRPTVGIFGPTKWAHFTKQDNFFAVCKDRDCMPCLRHPSCKEFDCMKELKADDILHSAECWLKDAIGDEK